jgi:beta-glucanase (GH16 family)
VTYQPTGTSFRNFALAVIAVACFTAPAFATYSLVWSDEFNGTALDLANWSYDFGNGCPDLCGWGNNELQYYRSQNVAVTGGNLVLTTKAENYGGYAFTSGKVHTRGKQSFLYGRIEMRAKIPTGGGMWPAFWMMPQDDVYGGWAASGEIDIMESSNATTEVGGALHFGDNYPNNTSTSQSHSLGGTNFADDFHIYAVEWEEGEIRWYVDDTLFMSRASSQWYTNAAPGNPQAPFDQEFFIILNTAVGGWYTGCTQPSCITADLPQEFVLDYVRVYEDIANFPPEVTITSPVNASTVPAGNIFITADASDPDGTVATVEFYADGNLLGEDTTEPYSFPWIGVPDGCYNLSAKAIDDLGGPAIDTIGITVGDGCGQEPFHGTPFVLPTRIQAEDFDIGGEGVAYHDIDLGNTGGAYRTDEDVDIEATSDVDGVCNVGWIEGVEWLEYTVTVPQAGQYTIATRVASIYTGRNFSIEFNGVNKTGDVIVPRTLGWQNWETVEATMTLEAGTQTMRFAPGTEGFNLNWFDITLDVVADVPGQLGAGHVLHPCYPNPFNPSTTISYELDSPATVRLTVYDVAGRLVRTLVGAESVGVGRHEIVWNGRDESGQVAATGIYFYRLDADGFSQTRRMSLIK